ncbi:hypothetical protein NESM_000151500 [Novymonas esmeraldas]|uniref:Peroxin-13 n=1 Tax=Novymonas esmeraldas TaxID=1808958 RepID=A0AAW0F530_9TRYP
MSTPSPSPAPVAAGAAVPGSLATNAAPAVPSLPSRAAVLLPRASPALTPQSGALTVTTGTDGVQQGGGTVATLPTDVAATHQGTVGATAGTSSTGSAGALSSGAGSGYGTGMDPYSMGGMYGGYGGYGGMGGMYGGMGGMYGGMGMMGMGGMGMGGMGMYGMGMMGMGMTPEAQRAQMMMFMTGRIMELWGMFSQVMQMTLGSAVQFVGEYVGINQRMGQLEEENLNSEERYMSRKYELRKALADIPREQRYVPKRPRTRKPKQPSVLRRLVLRLLRHVVLFAAAYFLAKRIASWVMARSGKKLLETSVSSALGSSSSGAAKLTL